MKAKLVKVVIGDEYRLDDENGLLIASSLYSSKNKLSLKNCQAIERGYDLDELATKICGNTIYDFEKHDFFRQGFQEALELMGDKKFSEDFLKRMCSVSFNFYKRNDLSDSELEEEWKNWFKNTIQSLQQTEWEVEIVMECCGKVYSQHCDGICEHVKPLLDADGCLILKRINL